MRKTYEEEKILYRTNLVSKRISELLVTEQEKLGKTQIQMAQMLDIPLQTYKRISSPKNASIINMINLGKIFENSTISYNKVFEGIYK